MQKLLLLLLCTYVIAQEMGIETPEVSGVNNPSSSEQPQHPQAPVSQQQPVQGVAHSGAIIYDPATGESHPISQPEGVAHSGAIVYQPGSSGSSSSASSSQQARPWHRPDFQAIFSACGTELKDCEKSGEGHHRRREHHGRHHGGHRHHKRCIKYVRQNWEKLTTTCRSAILVEMPCAEVAASYCKDSEGRHETFECLSSLESTKVTSVCSQWLKEREAWKAEHHGDHHHYEHGQEEEMFEEGHGRMLNQKERNHMIIMVVGIALFGAIIGSCVTMCCCMRRHRRVMRAQSRCSGACCHSAGAIPLHHIPSRGATNYAIMSDQVARAHPV